MKDASLQSFQTGRCNYYLENSGWGRKKEWKTATIKGKVEKHLRNKMIRTLRLITYWGLGLGLEWE